MNPSRCPANTANTNSSELYPKFLSLLKLISPYEDLGQWVKIVATEMEQPITAFIQTEDTEQVLMILGNSDFSGYLTKNTDSQGRFFYRLKKDQKTLGRSKNFKTATERDDEFLRFVDWIEVTIHGNKQRSFRFTN